MPANYLAKNFHFWLINGIVTYTLTGQSGLKFNFEWIAFEKTFKLFYSK